MSGTPRLIFQFVSRSILIILLAVFIAISLADVGQHLALYQKTIDRAFNDIQNDLNAQRHVYNQAFAKLNDAVNQDLHIQLRLAREQAQNECNRQVTDLTHHIQEVTSRSNSEKGRLQAEQQAQSQNADARISELVKNHQIELARVRSELNAVNAQQLDNLRRQLEGQISVAQNEVNRIQSQHEYALQNIKKKLELTRQDGENSYRNAQRKIQLYV